MEGQTINGHGDLQLNPYQHHNPTQISDTTRNSIISISPQSIVGESSGPERRPALDASEAQISEERLEEEQRVISPVHSPTRDSSPSLAESPGRDLDGVHRSSEVIPEASTALDETPKSSATKQATWIDTVGTWRWELLTWLFTTFTLTAMVLVMVSYHNKPLRDWHISLRPSTVISALSQAIQSSVLVSVSSCIGQLKWDWFRQSRKVTDLEDFDYASRGPEGCVQLLRKYPKIQLASLGALVTILMVTFSTFAQQAVRTDLMRWYNTTLPASIPIVSSFNATVGGWNEVWSGGIAYPIQHYLETAIETGMLGQYASPVNVTGTCPTGNCTWEPYKTLGFCSFVEDSSYLLTNHTYPPSSPSAGTWFFVSPLDENAFLATGGLANFSTQSWTLDGGNFFIGSSSTGDPTFQNVTSAELTVLSSLFYVYMVYPDSEIPSDTGPLENLKVTTGSFEICLQTLQTSMTNGTVNTTLLDQSRGRRMLWYPTSTELCTNGTSVTARSHFNFTDPEKEFTNPFCVEFWGTFTLAVYMARSRFYGYAEVGKSGLPSLYNISSHSPDFMYDLAYEIYNGDTTYSNGIPATVPFNTSLAVDRLSARLDNLAITMSNAIRTGPTSNMIQGTAWSPEQLISINFLWLVMPLVLYLSATTFFFKTIFMTKHGYVPIWKSSPVPLLQCLHTENPVGAAEITRRGKEALVQLQRLDGDWKLVQRENDVP